MMMGVLFVVYMGRMLMSIWMGETAVHELYTGGCGLYSCWVCMRAATIVYNWVPQGYDAVMSRVREWTAVVSPSMR